MKAKLEKLLKEYGPVAIVVYFAIFFLTLAGFAVALHLGVQVKGVAGRAGVLGAAYVATQLAKPLRFAATFALTPPAAALWRRLRARLTRNQYS